MFLYLFGLEENAFSALIAMISNLLAIFLVSIFSLLSFRIEMRLFVFWELFWDEKYPSGVFSDSALATGKDTVLVFGNVSGLYRGIIPPDL